MGVLGQRLCAVGLAALLVACSQQAVAPAPVKPSATPTAALSPTVTPPQPAPAKAQKGAGSWLLPDVAPLVEAAIEEGKLPGAVVAIGDRNGVRYVNAFGQRSVLTPAEPMTVDTVFDLASLTKPLATATTLLLLEHSGMLGVDEPVMRYLPEYRTGTKRTLRIRDLLLHRSGLPAVTPLSEFETQRAIALRKVLHTEPSEPRGVFRYSDIGYITLGALIERVSGQRLDQVAEAQVFAPLGMDDTGFGPLPAERRGRAAPTEDRDGVPMRGEVHDPRAYRLGGVAGNAGLFSTATDLARFATALLNRGQLQGNQVLPSEVVTRMGEKHLIGDVARTLGWDAMSGYSKLRGHHLSAQAFGHGGFTGTSLWVDPGRGIFVVFLSNRVHPDGQGNVIELVGAVTDAAVRNMPSTSDGCKAPPQPVATGLDRLVDSNFQALRGARVALVTNGAARDHSSRTTLQRFAQAHELELRAVLTPEHGLTVDREGPVQDDHAGQGAVPVHSLFGKQRTPTATMLHGADTFVFDLPDAGVRFFTYMSTLREVLKAGAELGLPVWLLDRPNPLGGAVVEGPMLDKDVRTFVQHHDLPVRHGMTAGELALLLNSELGIGADVHVVWMDGYGRNQLFSDTGLQYVAPSPNLVDEGAALLYPAVGLLEGSNVSVGRGTQAPFHVVGAPYADGPQLASALNGRMLPGVHFSPATFTPDSRPFAGERCDGVQVLVTNPRTFRAVETGLALAGAFSHFPTFEFDKVQRMLGSRETLERLQQTEPVLGPSASQIVRLDGFLSRRAPYLHYAACPSP